MPFPLNWSEELVSEYLELEGYFVRTNVPIPTKDNGGRRDLDVLGIKLEDRQLKFIHVEIGVPNKFDEMKKRFLQDTKNEVQRIAHNFGFEDYELECWYVYAWGEQKGLSKKWERIKGELKQEGVVLMTFGEVLTKIAESINQWRENHRRKTQQSSLPANLWLLKMLEALLLSKRLSVP